MEAISSKGNRTHADTIFIDITSSILGVLGFGALAHYDAVIHYGLWTIRFGLIALGCSL